MPSSATTCYPILPYWYQVALDVCLLMMVYWGTTMYYNHTPWKLILGQLVTYAFTFVFALSNGYWLVRHNDSNSNTRNLKARQDRHAQRGK